MLIASVLPPLVVNHVAAGLAALGMAVGLALIGYGLWQRRRGR